ncbi:hypothetical protein SK128_017674 [Halocaridina rubra]|uniref:Uncharacterized protein n=1 Tax=Halocaridina rubra TaxID=373956 RepID=A0AAN8WNR2_HALRR
MSVPRQVIIERDDYCLWQINIMLLGDQASLTGTGPMPGSTKRPAGKDDWLREIVEAGQDSLILRGLMPNTQYTLKWSGISGGAAKITIDTEGKNPGTVL